MPILKFNLRSGFELLHSISVFVSRPLSFFVPGGFAAGNRGAENGDKFV